MRAMWDEIGKRYYETGVDRAMLYKMKDNAYPLGVPWSGITSVEESPSGAESNGFYADNIKYFNLTSAEEYACTIGAYMYPDEFAECDGSVEVADGVRIGQQTRAPFGFCYRTVLGNDTQKNKYGYKLHLVYGCEASPSSKEHGSVNDSPEPAEMSWEVNTTPVPVKGHEPTATMEVDSTKTPPEKLKLLEDILYGKDPTSDDTDDGTDPRLPLPDEVIALVGIAAVA